MKNKTASKEMTLEDLARMVAKGFENTSTKQDIVDIATKQDIARLDKKIDTLRSELKQEISGLRNSVNNYLKLSDKRYLELKQQNKVLAKYLKLVIEKANIQVSTKELESILK